MDLKDVYAKLEGIEGGADLITAIKAEVQKSTGRRPKVEPRAKPSPKKLKQLLKK